MNNTELSIQISLGGFSFSLHTYDSAPQLGAVSSRMELYASTIYTHDLSIIAQSVYADPIDRVVVYCANDKVTVIPREVYDPQCAKLYLDALNLCALGDRVMTTAPPSGDQVIVWAFDGAMADYVEHLYPHTQWSHPLGELIDRGLARNQGATIDVMLLGGMANIAIFDTQSRLYAARSVRYNTVEDLLYFVHKMAIYDPHHTSALTLYGEVTEDMQAVFGQYYPNLSVLADPLFLVRL